LNDFFRYQIRGGFIGYFYLFTDGRLFPYTGKEQEHCGYSTQRSIPLPSQTNMITGDALVVLLILTFRKELEICVIIFQFFLISGRTILPKVLDMFFDREGYARNLFFWFKKKRHLLCNLG